MFYLLDSNLCNSVILYGVLNILKKSLTLIQIVGPILAMIALIISFTQLLFNPEENKYKSAIKNSLIALFILFFIPVFINIVLGLPGVDSDFTISKCWKAVSDNSSKIGK